MARDLPDHDNPAKQATRYSLYLFILLALFASLLQLSACGNDASEKPHSRPHVVAILKFATHPALDATERGVEAVLDERRRTDPAFGLIRIEKYNANGSPEAAKSNAESAIEAGATLLIAIATPAAQAAVNTPSSVPIVYGAVADPSGAGILASGRATGIRNVSPAIVARALEVTRTFFPRASVIGTAFNPAEQNSAYVQAALDELAPKFGFTIIKSPVTDRAQVSGAVEGLFKDCDVFYSANDNTVSAAADAAGAVARAVGKPLVFGDITLVGKGAALMVGLDYYTMGHEVGEIALRIIGGESVADVPPREAPAARVLASRSVLKALNVEVSEAEKQLVDSWQP